MNHNLTLTITSLLALLMETFHLAHDLVRGAMVPTGMITSVLILFVWLCGTVLLAGRRSGYIITLLGGVLAAGMPVVHAMGAGPAKGGFFFVWTLFMLGVTGLFAAILSVQAMRKPTA
jgi:hypothetical protein